MSKPMTGNLWEHEDQHGNKFLSGSWAQRSVLIVTVATPAGSTSPTHKIVMVDPGSNILRLANESLYDALESIELEGYLE